jgi:hypothetical protein
MIGAGESARVLLVAMVAFLMTPLSVGAGHERVHREARGVPPGG